jgi:hypothetical protein
LRGAKEDEGNLKEMKKRKKTEATDEGETFCKDGIENQKVGKIKKEENRQEKKRTKRKGVGKGGSWKGKNMASQRGQGETKRRAERTHWR